MEELKGDFPDGNPADEEENKEASAMLVDEDGNELDASYLADQNANIMGNEAS